MWIIVTHKITVWLLKAWNIVHNSYAFMVLLSFLRFDTSHLFVVISMKKIHHSSKIIFFDLQGKQSLIGMEQHNGE